MPTNDESANHPDGDPPPTGDQSAEIARLTAQLSELGRDLDVSRDATAAAMRRAGEMEAEHRVAMDKLAAAEAAQAEWTELIGHIERERKVAADVAAELEAVRGSMTWRVGRTVTTPYHWLRGRGEAPETS